MRGSRHKNFGVHIIREIQVCTRHQSRGSQQGKLCTATTWGFFLFVCFCFFLDFFWYFLFYSFFFCIPFFFFLFVFVYCCFYLVFKIFFFHLQKVKVARFSRGQQTQLNWKKKAGKIPPSITSTLKFPLVNHVDESQYCWGINHYN